MIRNIRSITTILGALFVLGGAFAQTAPLFTITSDVAEAYAPGEMGEVTFTITLDATTVNFEVATAFLNLIEVDAAGNITQRMHEIFEEATEEPTLFRVNWTPAELAAGQSTTLTFTIRTDAAPGDYELVLQVFSNDIIDPALVVAADRIGLGIFPVQITAR